MPKYILLNGPPRSGKDTAARAIINEFAFDIPTYHDKFSAPLKMAFAGMMEAEMDEEFVVEPYEATKEAVIPSLGVSFRQWQIDFSEVLMKPRYGNDVFGRLLWQRLGESRLEDEAIVVISDCGFQVEVDYLIQHAGYDNVLLLKLYREGCDFKNDSREYVLERNVSTYDIHNDSLDVFEQAVVSLVKAWLP